MKVKQESVWECLKTPTLWLKIGAFYFVMLLGLALSPFGYNSLGVIPRYLSPSSIYGVFMSWTMHGSWQHYVNNAVFIFPLLLCLLFTDKTPWRTLALMSLLTNALVWLLGATAIHIGASGIAYALLGYVVFAGLFRRRWLCLFWLLLSPLHYLGALYAGWIPSDGISVSSHLFGFAAGAAIASLNHPKNRAQSPKGKGRV